MLAVERRVAGLGVDDRRRSDSRLRGQRTFAFRRAGGSGGGRSSWRWRWFGTCGELVGRSSQRFGEGGMGFLKRHSYWDLKEEEAEEVWFAGRSWRLQERVVIEVGVGVL